MDATMPDRGLPLSLWGIWWNAILLLRPAFSRLRTFMWFVTAVAGLTVRVELLGVTSIGRLARTRGQERLLRAARRAHPRRSGMVQSRQAHLARQDARLARYLGYQGSLLLCRRCLLRRRQDGERPARAGQPSRDPGQIQRGGLRSRPAEERPQDKGTTQDLWQKDQAEVVACERQVNAAGCQSGLW